jgi:DNA-3-methyladenine glycosylase I
MDKKVIRCWNTNNPLHIKYPDEEWGVPLHDDNKLFEFLVLGGFQAGLTWWLILERREAFRQAFDYFNPEKVANYSSKDIKRLMLTPGIIHNKLKIKAAINNAKCLLKVQEEFGSFNNYLWGRVGNKVQINFFSKLADLPAETNISKNISEELKNRGFQFVGPKICYAFMQAVGMVNDHLISCFKHDELNC